MAKDNNSQKEITLLSLERSLNKVHTNLEVLTKAVKMNIAEQKRHNENIEERLNRMEKERKEDVRQLWEGIKKNADQVWSTKVVIAFIGGFTILIGGGAIVGKLMGWF